MANQEGTGQNVRKKSRVLNYFYLNGLLHKKLHINRGADTITTWCYPEHRRIAYTYSDVLRRKEPAFTMKEVGKMINRSRNTIENAIIRGEFPEPQHTYGLMNQEKRYKYMFSEKDIMALHAYLSTVHRGRPRKDGLTSPQAMPTPRELRALIRHNEIMYVKRNGEFVPTWDADVF